MKSNCLSHFGHFSDIFRKFSESFVKLVNSELHVRPLGGCSNQLDRSVKLNRFFEVRLNFKTFYTI